jgi:hypothetical protein
MGSHSLALLATVSGDSATDNIFPAIAEPIVLQFAGHGRRDSRNWFISFIWFTWFVRLVAFVWLADRKPKETKSTKQTK